MEQPKVLSVKLDLDTTEALEKIAKVKAELEQVIALQEKVNQLGASKEVVINLDGTQLARAIMPQLLEQRVSELEKVAEETVDTIGLIHETTHAISERLKEHKDFIHKIIQP